MVWEIKFTEFAAKQLKKLNKSVAKKILDYLTKKVATKKDITVLGKPLLGDKSGLWRFRVNDYRIICKLQDEEFTILVIKLGHRKDIYD